MSNYLWGIYLSCLLFITNGNMTNDSPSGGALSHLNAIQYSVKQDVVNL